MNGSLKAFAISFSSLHWCDHHHHQLVYLDVIAIIITIIITILITIIIIKWSTLMWSPSSSSATLPCCDHHHHCHHQMVYLDKIAIIITIWSTLMWSSPPSSSSSGLPWCDLCRSSASLPPTTFCTTSSHSRRPEGCLRTLDFKFVQVLLLIASSYICCRHPGNLRFLFTIIFQWYLLGISYPPSQKVKYIWRRILFKKRTKWISSVEIFKHPNFLLWIPESTESLF